MTTATANRSAGFSVRSAQAAGRASNFSLSAFFDMVSQSLAMAHAIPSTGRVGAKDVAKVRAIAEAM
nr:hypothetical protein [uncultured Noviherbaspirillum sp.]